MLFKFFLCFKPQMTDITGCLTTKNYHGLHILEHIFGPSCRITEKKKKTHHFQPLKFSVFLDVVKIDV